MASRVLARNSILNLAGLGVPLVVAVFAMPPIVDGLGPAGFGVLSLVWVVLGYMALLDLGLGRATTKFAAEALAVGDMRRVVASAHIALATQLVLGVVAGGVLALATPWLVEGVLNIAPELEGEAIRSFYFLAAIAPVVMVTNTFRGLLEARQRFGVINAVKLPVSTANFLLPLAGVLVGARLSTIVAALLLLRLAVLGAYAVVALRQLPDVRSATRVGRDDLSALLSFGGWVTVSAVISPVLVYLDRFVVGALRDVAAVGYYAAPHELIMRLTILPSSVAATLFPALSAAAASGDTARLQQLVEGVLKLLLLAAGPLLIVLGVLAPDVLMLWLGPDFAERAAPALRLFALGMAANVLAYVPAVLLPAAGRPDLPAKLHLVELPVHLVVLYVAVSRWGIAGGAGAWALRMWLDGALLFAVAHRSGLLRLPGVGSRLLAPALWIAAFAAVTTAAWALIDPLMVRWGAVVLLLGVMAGVAWLVLLSARERQGVSSALRLQR